MSTANRLAAEFIGTAWLAPIVGAVLAGLTYRWLGQEVTDKVVVADTPRRRYGRPERPGASLSMVFIPSTFYGAF